MTCSKILDMVYEESDSMPLFNQIQVWLHTIFCPNCAQEIERYQVSRSILENDFFPLSPGLEDSIMAKIDIQEELQDDKNGYAVTGGFSIRGWVIAGLIILFSLATAFFNFDFQNLTDESGISFLLPMGITIGIVLTTYGALFIGSHLKELSERFGL
ncbi:MAG: peptidoglycan-binding protein [Treponema sp.]|jgi:hypothetical protein|nr:peptidoglycan-binding protein [Treponema sp.]